MKTGIFKILAACALVLVASSCRKGKEGGSEPVPQIDVAPVAVDSVTLTKTYPGVLRANTKVDIVGRVNGTLLSQGFQDGQTVERGQVLFTIESTQYADAVRQAEAQLASAQSSLSYARSHYDAVKRALQSDAVSEMEMAQAESDLRNAEAAVHSAEAQLRTARTNLSYCTVRSPVRGRITSPTLSVGSMVSGEGQPCVLATVYDDTHMNAVFEVEDAQHLRMMMSARDSMGIDYRHIPLTFEETLPRAYTGDLSYVAPDIDAGTGTIELKAAVLNPAGDLRDGMYVNITLPYGFNPRAILVRDASIGTDQLGRFIYTVNDSNRVVYTPIKVGELVNDSMRVVLEGLTPQSRYVTRALLKVRDGMEIKPVTVKP